MFFRCFLHPKRKAAAFCASTGATSFFGPKNTWMNGFNTWSQWSPNPVRSPECGLDSIWAAKRPVGFVMILYHPLLGNMKYQKTVSPLPSLKPTASLHLKMHGWKTSFLLGWPFFRGVRKCLFPHVFFAVRWVGFVCRGVFGSSGTRSSGFVWELCGFSVKKRRGIQVVLITSLQMNGWSS